jgi:hypothetical protein
MASNTPLKEMPTSDAANKPFLKLPKPTNGKAAAYPQSSPIVSEGRLHALTKDLPSKFSSFGEFVRLRASEREKATPGLSPWQPLPPIERGFTSTENVKPGPGLTSSRFTSMSSPVGNRLQSWPTELPRTNFKSTENLKPINSQANSRVVPISSPASNKLHALQVNLPKTNLSSAEKVNPLSGNAASGFVVMSSQADNAFGRFLGPDLPLPQTYDGLANPSQIKKESLKQEPAPLLASTGTRNNPIDLDSDDSFEIECELNTEDNSQIPLTVLVKALPPLGQAMPPIQTSNVPAQKVASLPPTNTSLVGELSQFTFRSSPLKQQTKFTQYEPIIVSSRTVASAEKAPTKSSVTMTANFPSTNGVGGKRKHNSISREDELTNYREFLNEGIPKRTALIAGGSREEMKTTPLISWSALEAAETQQSRSTIPRSNVETQNSIFPQYGLLGHVVSEQQSSDDSTSNSDIAKGNIDPVFLNTNAPWSMFICGSQGSGKSHTLACVLESCLLPEPKLGKLPAPLAGLVMHFDGAEQQEKGAQAACLCEKVKTRVLVSPSNLFNMRRRYLDNFEGWSNMASNGIISDTRNITVEPFYLSSKHLNTERIMRLMGVNSEKNDVLYAHIIYKVLRERSFQIAESGEFNWLAFKKRLEAEDLNGSQRAVLRVRFDLVESFMRSETKLGIKEVTLRGKRGKPRGTAQRSFVERTLHDDIAEYDLFAGSPGELTVVDLSDPMIDAETACVLFEIALSLFVSRTSVSKVVALDEAHAYMRQTSPAAMALTNRLISNVREQRHRAVRVIVATQEPTINTALLDLCSISVVHRFSSPEWYSVVKKHLAAVGLAEVLSSGDENMVGGEKAKKGMELLKEIVRLQVGESLLFCPTAGLAVDENGSVKRLHENYVKFRTRPRLTVDGGKSKMAEKALMLI